LVAKKLNIFKNLKCLEIKDLSTRRRYANMKNSVMINAIIAGKGAIHN